MGNKGSNTTTTSQSGTSTVSPDSNAYQQYLALLNRASGVAATPYQGFTGEETAPINTQQQAGIGDINKYTGVIAGSGAPISASDIQRYQDPYTNQVINATQADFDVQNQRANSTVTGNAAAQGALGGDRVAVAQALTQEAQNRTQAPIIAGLRSQGYQQAVNTAENQQQQATRAGVAALQGAGQEVGAGTLQQQTQQAADTQARADYYQQQGYPFQVAQWLAGIDTAVGGSMGSTSTSTGQATTQGPTPNPWNQIVGLGMSAASMFAKRGGRIMPRAGFADIRGYDDGGEVSDDPGLFERFARSIHHGRDHGQRAFYNATRAGLYNSETSPEEGTTYGGLLSGLKQRRQLQMHDAQGIEDAVRGFATGGSPFGNIETWVPTAGVHAAAPTAHASLPSAPQAPKQQGLSQDQMKGFGVLAKGASNYLSGPSYGGGNFLTDAWGGSSSSPLEGLSAEDYGAGFGRGGRIRRFAGGGFADGGDTFEDRFDAAYPNFTAGVGASKPAFDAGPTYDDGAGPVRLSDPEDLDAWRSRVDRDNGRAIKKSAIDQGLPPPTMVATAPDETPELPSEVTSGVSSRRMTASAAPPEGAEEALGYAGPPQMRAGVGAPPSTPRAEQEPSSGGLLGSLGIKVTPELRQGLLQAGLSMMASTRGGPGSFLGALGEAGMTGVGAYTKTQEAALKQAQQEREQQIADEKLRMAEESHQQEMLQSPVLPNGQINPAWKAIQDYKGQMTDYQQAELQMKKIDQAIKMRTPIDLGTSISGAPIKGLPQIDSKGNVAIYPIDSNGTIGTEPIHPGGTIKPSAETVDKAAETWQPVPGAPPGAPGSRNEAYLDQIKREDAGQADAIRKAANYELDPAKYASMRRDQRQHFIDRVLQYDPNYSPQEVGLRYQAQRSFLPGTKNGDTITAFNTAISHLDTLKEMYGALKNGNSQLFNRLKNEFQTQFGYPAPNDVAALSSIIGGEVVKATVGAQNALGDREEVRHSISRDLSQMQADSVIDKYQRLMGGQLSARKFAYEQATGLHNFDDRFLLPRSKQVLNSIGSEGAAASPAAKPTITSKEEYDKLQPGTVFIKNGKEWTKP